jgi:hypothetical protein
MNRSPWNSAQFRHNIVAHEPEANSVERHMGCWHRRSSSIRSERMADALFGVAAMGGLGRGG